jgi:hypothetical protein
MPSSYSTTLGIELMVTGEKSGTWGDITNTNLNIVEQSQGYVNKSIAGGAQTTDLLITDGTTSTSDARNLIIELSGTITGNQIVTVPDGIEKSYIVLIILQELLPYSLKLFLAQGLLLLQRTKELKLFTVMEPIL